MTKLWDERKNYSEYSAKKYTISNTFGGGRRDFFCYDRKYKILTEAQLEELLVVARDNCWTALDLSSCGLSSLPDLLWEVTTLKVLYLGNMDYEEENNNNTFCEISEKIEVLKNLEALSICNIKNIKLPHAIKVLPNLVYLDCFGCDFSSIPLNLLNRNIRGIGIDCSRISQVAQICRMRKIEEIFLTNSQIKELPEEISKLKGLRTLYLRNTLIEKIPESLLELKNLKRFEIIDTPLEATVPEEIRTQTAHAVISFICKQQNQQQIYCFNESKMIIVGQGNVGKSCLLERIIEDRYEEKESTEGIDVKKWSYNRNKKGYWLNIWDFGGQEIYHSTHQFFLTKRSLYILVWDARAEEEYGRVDYWLKTIESFADDSPIIIAINKCDKKTTRVNRIDLKEYKEKYPQIVTILDISCKDNLNIDRLKSLIKRYASNLPITKERWLKPWYDVRRDIEELANKKKYISYEEYLNICKKYEIQPKEAKSLSKYLHDLGVILHYQDDLYLKGIVILSPEWATSAVYKILDSQENVLKNRNGVLHVSDLPLIWKNKVIYPEDKYMILLKIMEKFQLCFEMSKECYLVAELLEHTSIDCPTEWNFDKTACICIEYHYDFMPAGVMTRFIVNIHEYIANVDGKDMCWKKGVYLKHKTACARVVMKDTISEKKVEVRVSKQGNPVHQRELLYIIRKTISEINQAYRKIKVEEFVPCNCSADCSFQFSYDKLCNAVEKNIETIQCHDSFESINILELLEGIEIMKKEETNPYAISIQANPVISNTISIEAEVMQNNIINMKEIKTSIMEIQGDVSEICEEIKESMLQKSEEIEKTLEKINCDLDIITSMKTPEEVVKSGKLNKLKRWLVEFSDENSDIRKVLSGTKSIIAMVGGLVTKFNNLADKLGISLIN